MKSSKEVGLYIKSLREEKGLTQEQLGQVVGVQKAAVQKWENGTVQNLKREVIKALADYFDVSPSSFVIGNNEETFKPATRRQLKFALFGNPDEDDEILDDVIKLAKLQKMLRDNKEDK